jgi:HK97 family phage portal protein
LKLPSRLQKLLGIETKSGLASPDDWLFDLFGGAPASSGIRVTPKSAMTCAPVRAAVQAISEGIGQLPVHVYERAGDAKERAANHPAYKLLHDEANEWTPAALFREQITRDACLYPNGGFAHIVRVDGKPVELLRIDPEQSKVIVQTDNSEPVYKVQTGKGNPITVARENMLHIPSPSLNGEGLVHEAREAIGLALVMERHAARLFGNGARPSGVLSLKNATTPEALTKARTAWQAAHGGSNSGGTAVLPGDASWQALMLTSADAQFLELRKFAIDEIARVWRVPPSMLFELGRATWGNGEQQGRQFLDLCLMAWVSRWEGEIRLKLFTPEERATYFAEFLTDGFARADLAARMEAYSKAIAARILNPNEVRAMENRAPYAGGDKFENPNTSQGAAQ